MDIQRLRNLTTGLLHTNIRCIYQDLERLTGMHGLMTHMLPRAMQSVRPWLAEHATDPRLWDGDYDPTHTGDYPLPEPTREDRQAMQARYMAQPDPLKGKPVFGVVAGHEGER